MLAASASMPDSAAVFRTSAGEGIMTVTRRVSGEFAKNIKSIADVGARWKERGFVSSSLDESATSGWRSFKMTIHVPAGSPATTVDNIGESEVLINRGVYIRVTKSDLKNNHIECVLELEP